MSVLFLFGLEQLLIAKYLARAVKGDDLRSPACSAWVRIPQVLFLSNRSVINMLVKL